MCASDTEMPTGFVSYGSAICPQCNAEIELTGEADNSAESLWAVFKRGLLGVYHHASPKHLARYADEFAFRLNEGDVRRHTLERLDSLIALTIGRRLTYAELIS